MAPDCNRASSSSAAPEKAEVGVSNTRAFSASALTPSPPSRQPSAPHPGPAQTRGLFPGTFHRSPLVAAPTRPRPPEEPPRPWNSARLSPAPAPPPRNIRARRRPVRPPGCPAVGVATEWEGRAARADWPRGTSTTPGGGASPDGTNRQRRWGQGGPIYGRGRRWWRAERIGARSALVSVCGPGGAATRGGGLTAPPGLCLLGPALPGGPGQGRAWPFPRCFWVWVWGKRGEA